MRLMEFMWSQCKSTGDYQYDMNDPRDKKLHDCEQRNNQIRRDYRDMFAEPAQTTEPVDTDDEMSDDFSVKSKLSQQSLVDYFFVKDAQHSIDECEKPHGSDHSSATSKVMLPESDSEDSHNIHGSDNSSVSSSVVIPNSGNTLPVVNTIHNEVAVDLPAVAEPNMNNPFGHRRLKCHIPNFYYAIYHSDEHDDLKLKKLKEQNWVTDSLLEEMSQYYPTRDDVSRDPLSNDISMNKESFSMKFQQMFPAERVFINYMQLRSAVKIFFQHWNLLCKSSSKTLRCSYSHVLSLIHT